MTLSARLKHWSGVLRDVLGILAVPAISLQACLMVLLMWRGGWGRETEALRLTFFGYGLLALIAFNGFALFWLWQRVTLERVSVAAGPWSASLDVEQSREP